MPLQRTHGEQCIGLCQRPITINVETTTRCFDVANDGRRCFPGRRRGKEVTALLQPLPLSLASHAQRSDFYTVIARAASLGPQLTEDYDFTPAAVLNVNRAGELAKYFSSFCLSLRDHEKSVEERIIQSNATEVSDSGAFLNNSNSTKILFSVPEGCELKDVSGLSKKLSLLNHAQKLFK